VVQGCIRVEGATSVAGTRIGCDDEVIGSDVIRSILLNILASWMGIRVRGRDGRQR
jgi:hypothetical protein